MFTKNIFRIDAFNPMEGSLKIATNHNNSYVYISSFSLNNPYLISSQKAFVVTRQYAINVHTGCFNASSITTIYVPR